MKIAVVIVDMLKDFVLKNEKYQGKLYVENSPEIVPEIKEIKSKAEEVDVPVLYWNDAHDPNDKEFDMYGEHAVKDTYGAQVIDDLLPGEKNVVFEKQDLSGFTNSELEKYLKKEGIEELIIMGVATDYCVGAVALETKSKHGELIPGAIDRGYKVTVVVDAIKGIDEIVLPDGSTVPESKGAVAKRLIDMGRAGVRPAYTKEILEKLEEVTS